MLLLRCVMTDLTVIYLCTWSRRDCDNRFVIVEVRTEAVIQALKNYHQGKLPVPMPSKRMSALHTPPPLEITPSAQQQPRNTELNVCKCGRSLVVLLPLADPTAARYLTLTSGQDAMGQLSFISASIMKVVSEAPSYVNGLELLSSKWGTRPSISLSRNHLPCICF